MSALNTVGYTHTPQALTQHELERRGCSLHYWTGGSEIQPVVVMMHGATMNHRMFNAQVEALLPDYRVLVWDARGHGLSQPAGDAITMALLAEDMQAILDAQQIETCVLVGQSLGGYIAQTLYKQAPQRVQAMVIIGSTPIAKAYSRLEIWALKATMPLFKIWPYNHFTRFTARSIAVKDEVQQYALDAMRQIPQDAFLNIWQSVTFSIDHRGLPDFQIDVPLLLVHGDTDRTGTIKRDMPRWAESEAHTEFHIIPDAGHNANQDNPAVMNRLLLDFLSRHTRDS